MGKLAKKHKDIMAKIPTKAEYQAIIDHWEWLEKNGGEPTAKMCEAYKDMHQVVMDVIYGDGTDKPMGILQASKLTDKGGGT